MTNGSVRTGAKPLLAPVIVVGVVLASVVLASVTVWVVWHSHERALQTAHTNTRNLVNVLDRHMARMVDSIEIVMKTAGRELGPDAMNLARRSALDAWLADIARDLPHLHSVSLIDARSDVMLYDFVRSRDPIELLQAEVRSLSRGSRPGQLHIARPVFDEHSRTWLLPVARRVPPHQGSESTAIVVTISLSYLQSIYETLDIGAHGTVVLFRADGEILARRPYDHATVGKSIPAGPLFREHLPQRPSGTYEAKSAIDGVQRIISYRQLESTPIVAVVSLSVPEVLARWREELSVDFATAGICALLLCGLGIALVRAVRQREQAGDQLRMTLQHMDQGLLMVGPDQRTEVYNRRALELLDLPEALLAGRPLPHEVFNYQVAQGEFSGMSEASRRAIIQGALSKAPATYERTRPNGTVLEIRTVLLANGGAVRTYTDISERRRAIDEMNASMAFANSLVNSSPDCIQLLDLEGPVQFISDLGQELLEIDDFEAVRGRPFPSFFAAEHRARAGLALRRACDGQTDRFTRPCPTLGGLPKWWEFIITPVHEIGRPTERLFVVARDVTTRESDAEELSRAKEAAERASQAKTQFLAAMSHEMRTPLNAILGFATLALQRQDCGPELRRQVELIGKAGSALLTIINDVLDLSKIEAGKVELEERPLSLRELTEDCLSLTRGMADQKGLSLRLDFDENVPALIVADEARIRQVMLNLLNNAVKFTPSGSVAVTVGADPGRQRLMIAVSDTGIGISPERLPHLFKDFVQGDGSISRHYGGTGLGLSISKRLVELMGGEIGATSEFGQGSRFHVTLPLTLAAEEPADAAGAAPVRRVVVAPRHILLVDDLAINLEIVGQMLQSAGHRVETAEDGPSAIAAYRERRHDLILMDVQMPDMDGMETTRHIRHLDDQARHVPIVALTANVFSQQVESYRAAGMDDHLGKPFGRDGLLDMIERWTSGDRAPLPVAPAMPAPVAFEVARHDELVRLLGQSKVAGLLERFRLDMLDRFRSADPSAIRADAHATISTAGLLGFQGLSDAARGLEVAIDEDGDVAIQLGKLLASRSAALERAQNLMRAGAETAAASTA